MQVSAAALNRVRWGGRLVLTTVLLHFLELEVELDLLGSGYNANRLCDEMETLWTRTCRASKSLSSRVPHQPLTVLPTMPEMSSWLQGD
jgi:hypothetical protein